MVGMMCCFLPPRPPPFPRWEDIIVIEEDFIIVRLGSRRQRQRQRRHRYRHRHRHPPNSDCSCSSCFKRFLMPSYSLRIIRSFDKWDR